MGRGDAVPDRLAAAVARLEVGPDHDVLEVGCGPGVALGLIADVLARGSGTVVGLDRSATAIERSGRRIAEHVAAGRASLQETDLAHLVAEPDSFDRVLAVNVNVFWTTDAVVECLRLADVLRPGGRVVLAYESPPGSSDARNVGLTIAAKLEAVGLTADVLPPDLAHPVLVIVAHRPT